MAEKYKILRFRGTMEELGIVVEELWENALSSIDITKLRPVKVKEWAPVAGEEAVYEVLLHADPRVLTFGPSDVFKKTCKISV